MKKIEPGHNVDKFSRFATGRILIHSIWYYYFGNIFYKVCKFEKEDFE